MFRDPLYRAILDSLNTHLDGDLFEACASDLLRVDFPTLVPIRGGNDSGMDGATADLGPFLVCTTHSRVIDNLTKSLKSYIKSDGCRREALLATSRPLTKKKRTNLENRARELGVHLLHIYDQAAFADRLYHNPHWCKELLGVTTRPSALSVIPRTERPLIDQNLIGREDDLAWLQQATGDRLLIGQPGCGKTFLLRSLVLQGWGLFLVDTDKTAIADAIRSQKPKSIIVDDAHDNLQLLSELCQIRREIGAEFSIIATSWKGSAEEVTTALCLSVSQVREIDLLTRDQIVKVIKQAGVAEPVELVREIVNQAEGRPGLAVTLAFLCLQGEAREVFFGESLSRSISRIFKRLVGPEVNEILAVFSLGGDQGMPMQVVANFLDLSIARLRSLLVKLAAGGVIREDYQDKLSIWPQALRYILVRDIFFSKLGRLPYKNLLSEVPSQSEMALTLVEAERRGAVISDLANLLESVNSPSAWHAFASLGEQETLYVLEQHPEVLMVVGQTALRRAPEITLPMLIRRAIGDERSIHNALDHPLRWIQDWIQEAIPGTGVAVPRRRILLESLKSWFTLTGDERVIMKALCLVFSPLFGDIQADPGSGMTVTLRSALLQPDELTQLQEMWPQVKTLLEAFRSPDWKLLTELIQPWAYPEMGRTRNVPEEVKQRMRSFAASIVRDLARLSREHPAVQQWLRTYGQRLGVEIETRSDSDFEILFPETDRRNRNESQEKEKIAMLRLAESWYQREPSGVAARLNYLKTEALAVGKQWPSWINPLCQEIASRTVVPQQWLDAFLKAGVTAEAVEPFFNKMVTNRLPGWEEIAALCLEQPAYEGVAVSILLPLPGIPESLLKRVMEKIERYPGWVEKICQDRQLPDDILVLLLRHQDVNISSMAAIGEWLADPKTERRPEIELEWRDAIVRAEVGDHWLRVILKNDNTLAFDWLKARLRETSDLFAGEMWETVEAAVEALTLPQRYSLIEALEPTFVGGLLATELIGDNLLLYKEFLNRKDLAKIHLAPLKGHPQENWIKKAVLALNAGYAPDQVAATAFSLNMSWSGDESEMWQGWIDEFDQFSHHTDVRIQRVIEVGKSIALKNQQDAAAREGRDAIYGR